MNHLKKKHTFSAMLWFSFPHGGPLKRLSILLASMGHRIKLVSHGNNPLKRKWGRNQTKAAIRGVTPMHRTKVHLNVMSNFDKQ